jgi:hypothetical protein
VIDSDRQTVWLLVIAISLVRARSSWLLAAESRYSDAGAAGMKMKWDEVWLVKGRCVFGVEFG